MDGVHLTEAGQKIEVDYFYNLLVAPGEISFLAETAVQTIFQTITGIQQQIDLTQRLRQRGSNVWVNGQLSYLQLDNSSAGFPSDPGTPLSGSRGVDYKWQNGFLAGAALSAGEVNPTFSLGGGYRQDAIGLSLYAGYRNANWWSDLIGTASWLGYDTNRTVPIGITIQANNGSTIGDDLALAGEIGYDFHAGPVTHGPVAGFILQQARVNAFTESGSFTSLSFATQTRNSEVGAFGYQARFDWGQWHPFAQVMWDRSDGDGVAHHDRGAQLFHAGRRAGARLGHRNHRYADYIVAGLERTGLHHGTAGPGSRDQFWWPDRIELRAWPHAAATRLQELNGTCARAAPLPRLRPARYNARG
jgi:outer membrane lipase/esterase